MKDRNRTQQASRPLLNAFAPKGANVWVIGLCLALLGASSLIGTNVFAAAPTTKAENDEAKTNAEREKKLDAARKRLDEAAREVAELGMAMSEDAMPRIARVMGRQMSRAMLGVNIGSGRDDKQQDGVEIVSVSPGGAAAEAGLKAGDVLVQIKDISLKREGDESPRDKLLAVMREVEPEEKVSVRFLRDGKSGTAMIVARRSDRMFTMPLMPGSREPGDFPSFAFIRSHGVFGSAELVALTPKLGEYFGTERGLLVVRAPADSRLKLEEGDVIVDIDGRVPTNASHALRILGSYQPGEKLKLNVLRMKKRTTLDLTIPEDVLQHRPGSDRFFLHHDLDEPAPAMPAVPPAPPAPPRDDTA
jgi:S1-C subfamily serine protease